MVPARAFALALVLSAALSVAPVALATPDPAALRSSGPSTQSFGETTGVLSFVFKYQQHPEPARVPYAIMALSRNGSIRDPEQAGVYLGFLAGVLNRAGPKADRLLVQLTALPHEDQWILVRALAYSGLPDWQALMRRLVKHVPGRADMAQAYLEGRLATFDKIPAEDQRPSKWDDVKDFVTFHKRGPQPHVTTYENSPEMLDVLWGYYFATGDIMPVARIVALLPWSKNDESLNKLTIGNMAKFTLADNATKSPALLNTLKALKVRQPKDVAPILDEVIHAAEVVDVGYLRKVALGSIEDLKKRGPNSSRNMKWWGQVGESTIALGCLGAAVSGAGAAVGIPCVVGGALSSAGLKMLAAP